MIIRLSRLSLLGLFLGCLTVVPSVISALREEDGTDMDQDVWLSRSKRTAGIRTSYGRQGGYGRKDDRNVHGTGSCKENGCGGRNDDDGPKKDDGKCQGKRDFFRKCVRKVLKCMSMGSQSSCCGPADSVSVLGPAPCPAPSAMQVMIRALANVSPGDDDDEMEDTDGDEDTMTDDVYMMCRAVLKNGCGGGQNGGCPPRTYRVEGVVSYPFLTATDANGKNSGFIIELLELLKSTSMGTFDYRLTVQPANSNPALVDDLVNNKTDIAAADFAVLSARQAVIDFLQPYLRLQARIVVNNADGVLAANPTFYVLDEPILVGLLLAGPNVTLRNIVIDAQAANRVVSLQIGIAALLADDSPKAFIGVTPALTQAVQQYSSQLSVTPDILGGVYFAFGIQQNRNDMRLCLDILLLKVQESGQLQILLNKYNLD